MSRYAISDIHGCLEPFKALLDKLSFSKEDELYLLGDYIDRGPDSKGVIDHIWQLQNNGYSVRCLRGNHEENVLNFHKFDKDTPSAGYQITLDSFGISRFSELPQEYVDWMTQLPYSIVLTDYIFVHAGINFEHQAPLEDYHSLLFLRHWYDQIDKAWLNGRIIVHGHTPSGPELRTVQLSQLQEDLVLNIDGGCVYPDHYLNRLIAFDLDSHDLITQKNTMPPTTGSYG